LGKGEIKLFSKVKHMIKCEEKSRMKKRASYFFFDYRLKDDSKLDNSGQNFFSSPETHSYPGPKNLFSLLMIKYKSQILNGLNYQG